MYIHNYVDLTLSKPTKSFSAEYCWIMVSFPCDSLKNPGQQTCVYYGLAIKVAAVDQPTEIGITRKLYRPNLLFANSIPH